MTSTQTALPPSVAGKNRSPLISNEKFQELYSALLQCSILDEQLRSDSRYERWGGQQAATAGVVACMRMGDSMAPTPRSLLARCIRGKGPPSLSIPGASKNRPSPAEQLADAAGDALRHKLEKRGRITVLFSAAVEPDRMHEIFVSATKNSLPLFCILDESIHLAHVPGNIPVIRVDGSDAVAIYRVAHESIKRAREGGGPTLMECAKWPIDSEAVDPLEKLERYLMRKHIFRADWRDQIEKKSVNSLYDVLIGSEFQVQQPSPKDPPM